MPRQTAAAAASLKTNFIESFLWLSNPFMKGARRIALTKGYFSSYLIPHSPGYVKLRGESG